MSYVYVIRKNVLLIISNLLIYRPEHASSKRCTTYNKTHLFMTFDLNSINM
jgi:hypothetical protein